MHEKQIENKVVSNEFPSRVEAKNPKDEILCSDKMWDILLKTWDYDPILRIHLLSLSSIIIQLKSESDEKNEKTTSTRNNNSNKAIVSSSNTNININNNKMRENNMSSSNSNGTTGSNNNYIIIITEIIKNNYKMQLNIATPYGNPFTLDSINPSKKIIDIKKMIQRRESIPFDKQTIYYIGKVLENDKPLSYYDVENENNNSHSDYSMTSSSHIYETRTAPSSSSHIYETRTAPSSKVYYGRPMTIHIKTLYRRVYTFNDINGSDRIIDIKNKIYEKENHSESYSSGRQRFFTDNGKELENYRTLRDYNIGNDTTLILILRVRT